ncbi:hypothetical protein H1R20_g15764, partial [Candolleomyces eurysporus]
MAVPAAPCDVYAPIVKPKLPNPVATASSFSLNFQPCPTG